MSRYDVFQTVFKDQEVLAACLKERFGVVEVHDTPQTLYDYVGKARPEKAEIVVRQQHVAAGSNDLGFVRQPNGSFAAIISDYDRSTGLNDAWMTKLTVDYNQRLLIPHLEHQGFVVQKRVNQQGVLRLTMSRTR